MLRSKPRTTPSRNPDPLELPGFNFRIKGNPEPQETGEGPTKLRRRQRLALAKLLDKKLPGKGRRRIFIGPTGCGKSKLAKAIALADLRKGLKVVVAVPQHVIGAGFKYEEIVMPDGKVETWEPHVVTREADIASLKNFLLEPPTPDLSGRIFVCTHDVLRLAFKELRGKTDAWVGTSLIIDETHHSMYEDRDEDDEDSIEEENANELGKVVGHYLANDSGPITLMTATWLRSDGKIVGNQKSRFTIDMYHMDDYLKDTFKELNIRFKFILGDRVESLAKIVAADPHRKTIVWFPTISGWMPTPEAKWKLLGQCKSALKKLGVTPYDLVTDDEKYGKSGKREAVTTALLDAIEKQKDAIKHGKRPPNTTPDLLLALGLCQEGFDMPELSRAILLAPRGQIRQTIQMLGRLLRYWPGKTDVEFNIILPVEPEAVKLEKVLKIIFASMFVDWQFRRTEWLPNGKKKASAQVASDRLADPETSEQIASKLVTNAVNHDGSLSEEDLVDEVFASIPELSTMKPDEQGEGKKLLSKFFRQLHDADDVPLDPELRKVSEKSPIGGLISYYVSKCSAGQGTTTLRDLRLALGRLVPLSVEFIDQKIIEFAKARGAHV